MDDLPRPLRAARGPLTFVEPTASSTGGELSANGSGAAGAAEDSPPVSTWLEPSSRLCGAASGCPEGYGPTGGGPAGASLMSLNRLITADRSTRHAGRSTATSATNADRTVSPVTTITPTSPTKTSSSNEPHSAVQACRKPPIPTPRAPPAAPSSSKPSPNPGRPLARCSSPVDDTSSSTPPNTILAPESGASTGRESMPGPSSGPSPPSPARSAASLRRPPHSAAAPTTASPTGRAIRTRPNPAARPRSTCSPTGPAAENQTLPATSSPATMEARPQMSRRWRRTTEPTAAEPRRELRLSGLDPPEARSAGLAPLLAMDRDATSGARQPCEPQEAERAGRQSVTIRRSAQRGRGPSGP